MIASPPVIPSWQPLVEAPVGVRVPAPASRRGTRGRPASPSAPLATLAHELRAPLHSLSASAAVLAEDLDELSPDQIRQMARAIQRRAVWLQGLTENLLCAATTERGGLSIMPELYDLRAVVEETVLVLEPILTRRGQRVELSLPTAPATALVDARRFGQALANLILNASKYSDPGAPIQVTVAPAGGSGRWRVTVADEGMGLPPGDVAALFEPYVRGADTGDGLGLGLAVVKSIAAAHNGLVGAAPREGRGAEFWIEL
jgi:two-component system, OmpR family, sensor histidine kinase KdpD